MIADEKGGKLREIEEIEGELFTKVPIDILFSRIETLFHDSKSGSEIRARASYLMGFFYESKDYQKAKKYYEFSYAFARQFQHKRLLSDTLHAKAVDAFKRGKLNEVMRLEQESLALALEAHHPYRIGFCHFMLATVASYFGVIDEGVAHLIKGSEVAEEYSILKIQCKIFSKLAEFNLMSGDWSNAKKYAIDAVSSSTAIDVIEAKLRLATVELELKDFGEVSRLVNGVRAQLKQEDLSPRCLTHTILGKVHYAKKEWELAEQELKQAITLATYPNSERVRSNIHCHLCELYLAEKKWKMALEESLEALEDAQTSQDVYCQKESLRLVQQCHKELGNFAAAYNYLEQYNALVAESDTALLKSRLEYHALKNDYELEKARSETQTKKSELLRIKLDYKERELTEKIRHLIKQAEAVRQFRNDLRALIRRTPADDPSVKDIRARLASFTEEEINWQEFEKDFKEAHPEFLQTLSEKYPDLTRMEHRIAAMIRMDLKSADIAKLFSITERAVEFHRLNLRKKLQLKKTEQLTKFLTSL